MSKFLDGDDEHVSPTGNDDMETEGERAERHERERVEDAERYEKERKESHDRHERERKEEQERREGESADENRE